METARLKNDERLLTLIGATADCVAREVKYHSICFKNYTANTKSQPAGEYV